MPKTPETASPRIDLIPVDQLAPYARNARTHTAEQIALIARSIEEWGFTNAILADGKGIVAGHGRALAAQSIYAAGGAIKLPDGRVIPTGCVPVVDCSGWNDAQRRAYVIADNALALRAGWDMELLRLEVDEIKLDDFDVSLLGLGDELSGLLGVGDSPAPDRDPDDAPPAPDVPRSKPGDVWVLGPHRVMCGSATSPAAWHSLMSGDMADVVWTDPPYNVDIGRKNTLLEATNRGAKSATGGITGDRMDDGAFYRFLLVFYKTVLTVMKPGAAIYVAHADGQGEKFRGAFLAAGFHLQSCLIWNKNVHAISRWDYQPKHEPVLYGWKPGAPHRWYGGRKQTTVAEYVRQTGGDSTAGTVSRDADGRYLIRAGDAVLVVDGQTLIEERPTTVFSEAKPVKSDLHPTMKPVALVERMLKSSARAGDVVVDAFGGSGATLIAADRLGMRARLMEIDPRFVDVIVRRWQDWRGQCAIHAQTGEAFDAEIPDHEPAALPA